MNITLLDAFSPRVFDQTSVVRQGHWLAIFNGASTLICFVTSKGEKRSGLIAELPNYFDTHLNGFLNISEFLCFLVLSHDSYYLLDVFFSHVTIAGKTLSKDSHCCHVHRPMFAGCCYLLLFIPRVVFPRDLAALSH